MNFNPTVMFWMGVGGTLTLMVGTGTVSLTDAVPAAWIPTVKAWCAIDAVVISTILTAAQGFHPGNPGGAAGPLRQLMAPDDKK